MSGITHKWNGTILTVTSDSGTSSADLKGEKGDTGIRGAQGRTGFTIGNDGLIDTSGLATQEYVDNALTITNVNEDYTYTLTRTDGKGMFYYGTVFTNTTNYYLTTSVTPKDNIRITGYQWSEKALPVYMFYDSEDNIISYYADTEGAAGVKVLDVEVPENAVKLLLNGSTNSSAELSVVGTYTKKYEINTLLGEVENINKQILIMSDNMSQLPTKNEVDITLIDYATKEYVEDNYTTEEDLQRFIADNFSGVDNVLAKQTIVANAIALGSWNGTTIVSSAHDSVTFTSSTIGSKGISKNIEADITKPLYIKLNAEFDSNLFTLYINAFSNGSFVSSCPLAKGTNQYELSIKGAASNTINFIISTYYQEAALNKPITISALEVWQEIEKYSVVVDLDEDKVLEIVENANITNSPYYTAPNGESYILQVNNSGDLIMSPVIPTKALFIGNSLLMGFGFGMAASDSEHDYYYLVNQAILNRKSNYTATKLAGYEWESSTTTAAQTNFMNNVLAPVLTNDLELVIVQLGDNVNTDEKLAVFEEGSRNLLEFIRNKCPKARVCWVGAWYQTATKQEQMKAACDNTGVVFINIWDLATTENKNAVGNKYIDENGVEQTITSAGVASHPNDNGFRLIANRILYKLGIVDTDTFYE